MSSRRKCIFGCQGDYPLFGLPKNDTVLKQWLDFILGGNPPLKKKWFICAMHFTDESFLNKREFDRGLITRLSLKDDAIPTLRSTPAPLSSPQGPPATTSSTFATTASSYTIRSVATQLSAGTLRSQHYRSKGVQATVHTTSRGTSTEQSLSSMPAKSGFGTQSKRPRLELGEEEDDDFSISIPVSPDSMYEPVDAVTDQSDLSDMESSSEFEDAKYIVSESTLRELFENCPVCRKHCIVDQRRCGAFVAFKQDCPHCSFSRKWQSQPVTGNGPQGNL